MTGSLLLTMTGSLLLTMTGSLLLVLAMLDVTGPGHARCHWSWPCSG